MFGISQQQADATCREFKGLIEEKGIERYLHKKKALVKALETLRFLVPSFFRTGKLPVRRTI